MKVRSLLIPFVLLLTTSCSLFVQPESDSTQQEPVPSRQWFFLHGDEPRLAFAWISGPGGKYPVLNYYMRSISMKSGRRMLGDSADYLIELPRPLAGQNLTLVFPEADYPFHRTQQPKITCRIKVNGEKIRELTAVMPKSAPGKPLPLQPLQLAIPAKFTTGHLLKVTFEYLPPLKTAAQLGEKGNHKPGIGFAFLKPVPEQARIGWATFLVRESSQVKDGRQHVELDLVRHMNGLALPDRIGLDLGLTPYDPPKGFQPNDLVDLALAKNGDGWTVLYGGLPAEFQPGRLPISNNPAFYYPPKKLPETNPPLPEPAVEGQKKQILKDLMQTRAWLRDYRRDAAREERLQREWFRRQKDFPLIAKAISPETGQEVERYQNHFRWGNIRGSCFALAKNYEFKRAGGIVHNIGALNELKRLLKSCNIQLIVMLVPDPERLAANALLLSGRLAEDPVAVQCAATLLEYGIEAIYADPVLLAASSASEQLFLYPSSVPGTDLWSFLADLAADRLEVRFGKDAFAETGPMHYRQVRSKTVFGDNSRWPEGVACGDRQGGEVVEGRLVLRDGQPFQPDPASKILVIGGDSLNLPGPGHTFTGLLSMRLRYAVDEMIPGRGTWLHNLPLILQSDPARWLKGKQVCLMMVPARMLENGILPNLRTQSELYAKLCREKEVFRFPPVKNNAEIILPAPVPGERLFKEKTAWNRFWQNTSGTQFMIAEDDQPLLAAELTVPEPYTKAPFTFFASVLNYPGQSVTLLVNGRKIPLLIEGAIPFVPRPMALELPAGTTSIKLEISGRRGDLIRIQNLRIYR